MRIALSLAAVAAAVTVAGTALAQQATTTRIETRPYYGAVVTIEHGVRVYRPVPPTHHMIINPEGKTPLELDIGGGNTTINQNSNAAVIAR
jgi:hypothetical protein